MMEVHQTKLDGHDRKRQILGESATGINLDRQARFTGQDFARRETMHRIVGAEESA